MALFRNVNMSFWTDAKVNEDFTPEDRYFYLYLMTNPHTNILGCYEVSLKQMSDETGYTKEIVQKIIERLTEVHDVINYSYDTKEVLIKNWYKYNWNKSDKLEKALQKAIEEVKSDEFREFLVSLLDTLCIPYTYPMHTTNSNSNSNSNSKRKIKKEIDYEQIIAYLNEKVEAQYRVTPSVKAKINARYSEGFTSDDFKKVIDNMSKEWKHSDMRKYLRPETLFGTKFDGYLNRFVKSKSPTYDATINPTITQEELKEVDEFFRR